MMNLDFWNSEFTNAELNSNKPLSESRLTQLLLEDRWHDIIKLYFRETNSCNSILSDQHQIAFVNAFIHNYCGPGLSLNYFIDFLRDFHSNLPEKDLTDFDKHNLIMIGAGIMKKISMLRIMAEDIKLLEKIVATNATISSTPSLHSAYRTLNCHSALIEACLQFGLLETVVNIMNNLGWLDVTLGVKCDNKESCVSQSQMHYMYLVCQTLVRSSSSKVEFEVCAACRILSSLVNLGYRDVRLNTLCDDLFQLAIGSGMLYLVTSVLSMATQYASTIHPYLATIRFTTKWLYEQQYTVSFALSSAMKAVHLGQVHRIYPKYRHDKGSCLYTVFIWPCLNDEEIFLLMNILLEDLLGVPSDPTIRVEICVTVRESSTELDTLYGESDSAQDMELIHKRLLNVVELFFPPLSIERGTHSADFFIISQSSIRQYLDNQTLEVTSIESPFCSSQNMEVMNIKNTLSNLEVTKDIASNMGATDFNQNMEVVNTTNSSSNTDCTYPKKQNIEANNESESIPSFLDKRGGFQNQEKGHNVSEIMTTSSDIVTFSINSEAIKGTSTISATTANAISSINFNSVNVTSSNHSTVVHMTAFSNSRSVHIVSSALTDNTTIISSSMELAPLPTLPVHHESTSVSRSCILVSGTQSIAGTHTVSCSSNAESTLPVLAKSTSCMPNVSTKWTLRNISNAQTIKPSIPVHLTALAKSATNQRNSFVSVPPVITIPVVALAVKAKDLTNNPETSLIPKDLIRCISSTSDVILNEPLTFSPPASLSIVSADVAMISNTLVSNSSLINHVSSSASENGPSSSSSGVILYEQISNSCNTSATILASESDKLHCDSIDMLSKIEKVPLKLSEISTSTTNIELLPATSAIVQSILLPEIANQCASSNMTIPGVDLVTSLVAPILATRFDMTSVQSVENNTFLSAVITSTDASSLMFTESTVTAICTMSDSDNVLDTVVLKQLPMDSQITPANNPVISLDDIALPRCHVSLDDNALPSCCVPVVSLPLAASTHVNCTSIMTNVFELSSCTYPLSKASPVTSVVKITEASVTASIKNANKALASTSVVKTVVSLSSAIIASKSLVSALSANPGRSMVSSAFSTSAFCTAKSSTGMSTAAANKTLVATSPASARKILFAKSVVTASNASTTASPVTAVKLSTTVTPSGRASKISTSTPINTAREILVTKSIVTTSKKSVATSTLAAISNKSVTPLTIACTSKPAEALPSVSSNKSLSSLATCSTWSLLAVSTRDILTSRTVCSSKPSVPLLTSDSCKITATVPVVDASKTFMSAIAHNTSRLSDALTSVSASKSTVATLSSISADKTVSSVSAGNSSKMLTSISTSVANLMFITFSSSSKPTVLVSKSTASVGSLNLSKSKGLVVSLIASKPTMSIVPLITSKPTTVELSSTHSTVSPSTINTPVLVSVANSNKLSLAADDKNTSVTIFSVGKVLAITTATLSTSSVKLTKSLTSTAVSTSSVNTSKTFLSTSITSSPVSLAKVSALAPTSASQVDSNKSSSSSLSLSTVCTTKVSALIPASTQTSKSLIGTSKTLATLPVKTTKVSSSKPLVSISPESIAKASVSLSVSISSTNAIKLSIPTSVSTSSVGTTKAPSSKSLQISSVNATKVSVSSSVVCAKKPLLATRAVNSSKTIASSSTVTAVSAGDTKLIVTTAQAVSSAFNTRLAATTSLASGNASALLPTTAYISLTSDSINVSSVTETIISPATSEIINTSSRIFSKSERIMSNSSMEAMLEKCNDEDDGASFSPDCEEGEIFSQNSTSGSTIWNSEGVKQTIVEAVKKRKWIVCAKAFVGLVGDHDAEMCSYILPDALKQAPIKISQAFNCFLDALTQVRRVKVLDMKDYKRVLIVGVALMSHCATADSKLYSEAYHILCDIPKRGLWPDLATDGWSAEDITVLKVQTCVQVNELAHAVNILEEVNWFKTKPELPMTSRQLACLKSLSTVLREKCKFSKEKGVLTAAVRMFVAFEQLDTNPIASAECKQLFERTVDLSMFPEALDLLRVLVKHQVHVDYKSMRHMIRVMLMRKMPEFLNYACEAALLATKCLLYPRQGMFDEFYGGRLVLWTCLTEDEMFVLLHAHMSLLCKSISAQKNNKHVNISLDIVLYDRPAYSANLNFTYGPSQSLHEAQTQLCRVLGNRCIPTIEFHCDKDGGRLFYLNQRSVNAYLDNMSNEMNSSWQSKKHITVGSKDDCVKSKSPLISRKRIAPASFEADQSSSKIARINYLERQVHHELGTTSYKGWRRQNNEALNNLKPENLYENIHLLVHKELLAHKHRLRHVKSFTTLADEITAEYIALHDINDKSLFRGQLTREMTLYENILTFVEEQISFQNQQHNVTH